MGQIPENIDRNGRREQFDLLMEEVTAKNPPFPKIFVYSTDRISRSDMEWMACTRRMEANGIQAFSAEKESSPSPDPDSQREQMRNYAEEHGIEIMEDHVYTDDGEGKPKQ